MLFEFSSEYVKVTEIETMNGTKVEKTRIKLNTDDVHDVEKLGLAYDDVLVNYLEIQTHEETEKEFMDMCLDFPHYPDIIIKDTCKDYFNKYAERILNCLISLEPTAWDIFNFLETEEEMHYNYSCDDHMASALYPMGD